MICDVLWCDAIRDVICDGDAMPCDVMWYVMECNVAMRCDLICNVIWCDVGHTPPRPVVFFTPCSLLPLRSNPPSTLSSNTLILQSSPHYDTPRPTPTQKNRQIAKFQPHLFHTSSLDTGAAVSSALRPLCHWGKPQIQFWRIILTKEKIRNSILLQRINLKYAVVYPSV